MSEKAFQGILGSNTIVATGAASASFNVVTPSKSVRLVNSGSTNVAHVRIGRGAQIATLADLPVLPGESLVVHKADDDDTVAYIQDVGTTTLHVQPGEGGI